MPHNRPWFCKRLISSSSGPHRRSDAAVWLCCCRQSITVIFYLCLCQVLIHLRCSQDVIMRQSGSLEMSSYTCACRLLLFHLPVCVSRVVVTNSGRRVTCCSAGWEGSCAGEEEKNISSSLLLQAKLWQDGLPFGFQADLGLIFFVSDWTIKEQREWCYFFVRMLRRVGLFCIFHSEPSDTSDVSESFIWLFLFCAKF